MQPRDMSTHELLDAIRAMAEELARRSGAPDRNSHDHDMTPIQRLPLQYRIIRGMMVAGVRYIGDLRRVSMDHLRGYRGIGECAAREIERTVKAIGITMPLVMTEDAVAEFTERGRQASHAFRQGLNLTTVNQATSVA